MWVIVPLAHHWWHEPFCFLYDDDDSVSNEFDGNLLKVLFFIFFLFSSDSFCLYSFSSGLFCLQRNWLQQKHKALEEEITSGQVLLYSPGKMANQERPAIWESKRNGIIQEEKKENKSRVKSFHGLFYNLFLSFSSFFSWDFSVYSFDFFSPLYLYFQRKIMNSKIFSIHHTLLT